MRSSSSVYSIFLLSISIMRCVSVAFLSFSSACSFSMSPSMSLIFIVTLFVSYKCFGCSFSPIDLYSSLCMIYGYEWFLFSGKGF